MISSMARLRHLWAVAAALALSGVAADWREELCGPQQLCQLVVDKGDLFNGEFLNQIMDRYGLELSDLLALNPRLTPDNFVGLSLDSPVRNLTVPCEDSQTAATMGASVEDLLCHRLEQSLMLRAVGASSLAPLMEDPSLEATVFAPKNSALRALLSSANLTFDQLLEDTELLDWVLSYHVVPGAALSGDDLVDDLQLPTLLEGHNLTVVQPKPGLAPPRLATTSGQEVKVIKRDFSAGAATVHVVGRVLLPEGGLDPEFAPSPPPSAPTLPPPPSPRLRASSVPSPPPPTFFSPRPAPPTPTPAALPPPAYFPSPPAYAPLRAGGASLPAPGAPVPAAPSEPGSTQAVAAEAGGTLFIDTATLQQRYTACPLLASPFSTCEAVVAGLTQCSELAEVVQQCQGVYDLAANCAPLLEAHNRCAAGGW